MPEEGGSQDIINLYLNWHDRGEALLQTKTVRSSTTVWHLSWPCQRH